MALFKRGRTWWVRFTTPGGKRVRCSAGTSNKAEAQEYHDKLKAETWRVEQMGQKISRTWDDAGYKWLLETQHKATHEGDKAKLVWLQTFLRGKLLHEVNRELVETIGETKRAEASAATANRYLALVRSILRKAWLEWEWIDKIPKIRLYSEPKRRVEWLTPEQVKVLVGELPEHQRDVVLFALSTGLRQANIKNLEWSQVDLARKVAWIHPDQAKARAAIHVSLNSIACAVLKRQQDKHKTRVFTYCGRPVKWLNTKAWREALQRAGIAKGFRWHSLRHTWASWLAQSGTPMNVLQEMGGWESPAMVRRYAHLSPAQFAGEAESIARLLRGTKLAQRAAKKSREVVVSS